MYLVYSLALQGVVPSDTVMHALIAHGTLAEMGSRVRIKHKQLLLARLFGAALLAMH